MQHRTQNPLSIAFVTLTLPSRCPFMPTVVLWSLAGLICDCSPFLLYATSNPKPYIHCFRRSNSAIPLALYAHYRAVIPCWTELCRHRPPLVAASCSLSHYCCCIATLLRLLWWSSPPTAFVIFLLLLMQCCCTPMAFATLPSYSLQCYIALL